PPDAAPPAAATSAPRPTVVRSAARALPGCGKIRTMNGRNELDAETLNSRLRAGHRLLVKRVNDRIVAGEVEFFDETVPLSLFHTYLANGMIEVPKDGLGYKLS